MKRYIINRYVQIEYEDKRSIKTSTESLGETNGDGQFCQFNDQSLQITCNRSGQFP